MGVQVEKKKKNASGEVGTDTKQDQLPNGTTKSQALTMMRYLHLLFT
jgi:hypothetical protein